MTKERFERIRGAVEVLSGLEETEWQEIEEFFLAKVGLEASKNVQSNADADIDKKIGDFLKHQGIPAHLNGYKYLREALKYVMQIEDMYQVKITKELYPYIAKKCDTTRSRVERGIRHAIEVAWDRGDCDEHDDLFGFAIDMNRGKPTNTEAILTFAEYLKNN